MRPAWGPGFAMIDRISVELRDARQLTHHVRLLIDGAAVGEGLTAVQAHILLGEVLDRVTPRSAKRAGDEHGSREKRAAV